MEFGRPPVPGRGTTSHPARLVWRSAPRRVSSQSGSVNADHSPETVATHLIPPTCTRLYLVLDHSPTDGETEGHVAQLRDITNREPVTQLSMQRFHNRALNLLERRGFIKDGKGRVVWATLQRHDTAFVTGPDGQSWLVKRCGRRLLSGTLSLKYEALFHRELAAGRLPAALTRYVPKLLDAQSGRLLIFQGIPDHISLRQAFLDNDFEIAAFCGHVGRGLAILHSAAHGRFPAVDNPVQTHGRCTPEMLGHAPVSYLEVLRLLQTEPELNHILRQLRASWQPTALIHGDPKTDNVLVMRNRCDRRPVLVDWELIGVGDPAWDCGSFIGSLCYLWIESLRPGIDVSHYAGASNRILAAIRQFWHSYDATRRTSPTVPASSEGIGTAFQWSGYWLLQRVIMVLPLRRTLSALEVSALHLGSRLLQNDSHEIFLRTQAHLPALGQPV